MMIPIFSYIAFNSCNTQAIFYTIKKSRWTKKLIFLWANKMQDKIKKNYIFYSHNIDNSGLLNYMPKKLDR